MSRFKTMINRLNHKALAPILGLLFFTSCQDLYFEDMRKEYYTRNFIKEFGLIDPDHDWNMATQALVKVNIGPQKASSVKIYAKHESKYYLVADIDDVAGKLEVPVDVPKTCNEIMVKVDKRKYYGQIGREIDCSSMSRGVPDGDDYSNDTNNNPTIYEAEKGQGDTKFKIKVQYTNIGNMQNKGCPAEYEYFNTQQISPIVSTGIWEDYYSINKGEWNVNPYKNDSDPDKGRGLIPESGVYNRKASDLTNWLAKQKNYNREYAIDFTVTPEDGTVTFFPFYYGTNLQHELGIYLLDDDDNPIMADGTAYREGSTLNDWVSFPIFKDRDHGDLQIRPKYDSNIQDIKLSKSSNVDTDKFEDLTLYSND